MTVSGGDVGFVKVLPKCLRVLCRFGDDDEIHQCAGHTHRFRIRNAIHNALNLGDDDATMVFRRLRDRQHLADEPFAFHGQIAAPIGTRGANESHRNGKRAVTQPRFIIEREALH